MVEHYLKDGTRVNDITGHIVRVKDARTVYTLIGRMNEARHRSPPKRKDLCK